MTSVPDPAASAPDSAAPVPDSAASVPDSAAPEPREGGTRGVGGGGRADAAERTAGPAASRPSRHPAPARPPRRHGANLTRAIHRAALTQLAETSVEELGFDKIAAAAGAGKASLYRRWSTPAELLLEALTDPVSGFGETAPQPHTGALRSDLLELLGGFTRALDQPHGRALRPLLAHRTRHPELYAQVDRLIIQPHKEILLSIVRDAVERGEARPQALTRTVAGVGPRMIISLHMENDTVSRADLEVLVDEVLLPLLRAPGAGTGPA